MRPGSFRRTRQRAVRAVAGLVAAFLLTGNVLAAAGLCRVKAPVEAGVAVQTAAEAAAQVLETLAEAMQDTAREPSR